MQRRCCWPPESAPPGRVRRSLTSSQRWACRSEVSTTSSRADRLSLVLVSAKPAVTFSAIDMAGNGLGFWNTMPICLRAWVILYPDA